MKFRLTSYAVDQITKKKALGASLVVSLPRTRSMEAVRINLGPVFNDQTRAASQAAMKKLYDRNKQTALVEVVEETSGKSSSSIATSSPAKK